MSISAPSILTRREIACFAAAAERILPAVPGLPSATEVNAHEYLRRRASEAQFAPIARQLREGFEVLDTATMERFGMAFADASPEQRDAVLQWLDAIPTPALQGFLEVLIKLTATGYLCDPIHGGNQGGKAWRALGIRLQRIPQSEVAGLD